MLYYTFHFLYLIFFLQKFNLYKSNSLFNIKIKRERLDNLQLNKDQMNVVKNIQFTIYNDMLNIKTKIDYENFLYGFFIVFMTSSGHQLNWDLMNELNLKNFTVYEKLNDPKYLEKVIREQNLVKLKWNKNRFFKIKKIEEGLNASCSFPKIMDDERKLNFAEYFSEKCGLETKDLKQPLVELNPISVNLNFLLKTTNFKKEKREKIRKYRELFIAENFLIFPFKENQIYTIIILPTVIHRLNSLLKAIRLKDQIEKHIIKDLNVLNVS